MPWDDIGKNIGLSLKDPDGFIGSTFRTIPIKKDKPRVNGLVAKPKGGGPMTLTALRFPKEDGWTLETAKEWYDARKEDFKSASYEEASPRCIMERKELKFTLEEVSDAGEFVGTAAVYGNVDLGKDRILPGAFTKTISENGAKVPMLLDHKFAIGISELSDSPNGLRTRGILNMDKSIARETHSDLKFYQTHGRPYGMSIGYEAVKKEMNGDIRDLKEIKLYETSVTLFPMNPLASVTSVKTIEDFAELLEEIKEGRTYSAATLARMQEIMNAHAALMEQFRALMDSANNGGKGVNDTSEKSEAVDTSNPDAAPQQSTEPDQIHSSLDQFRSDLLSDLKGVF